jgi:peptide/nickel transport system substrate-binding protein
VQDPEVGSPATDTAQQMTGIDVVDDVTLRVTLENPNADWPVLLNATLGMIPSPTAMGEHGDQYGTSAETTVGAGPFILTSWERDVRKVFERNPDYWDAPRPYLDSYVITQIPDPQTRLDVFRSGQGDLNYMPIGGPVLLDLLDEFPYSVAETGGLTTWAFNFRDGHPTTDQRLRRAMVAAVDVEAVVERGSPGVIPASTLFPEGHVFYAPIEQPHNDLEAAQTFMDDYLEATGQESETVRLVTNAQFTELAEALKQDFDRVDGLDVEIEVVESVLTAGLAGDFDLLLRGLGGQVPGDWAEHLTTGGLANRAGVSLPELDEVFRTVVSTDDVDARREALEEMQRIFMEQAPHLLVYTVGQYVFYRDTVANVEQLSRTAVDAATLQAAD